MKSGDKIERTFKDVEESFVFDLQTDSQQIFSFPLQGLSSSYREYEDGFLIISLFTIGRLKARRKKLGELVLQVESFYYWTTLNFEIPAASYRSRQNFLVETQPMGALYLEST